MTKILERWRVVSLQVRLIIQLSAALGIGIAVFLYASNQTLKASIQVELQERQDIARLLADRVDMHLDQAMNSMLGFLTQNESTLNGSSLEPKKEILHHLYTNSSLFKRVFLLDNSGTILWMDPYNDALAGANITNPPYNRSLEDINQPAFFPTIGRQSKTPGIILIVPIYNTPGSNTSYLLGWIDFGDPRARSLMYPYQPGSEGYTDLVDKKGIVLASTDPERVGRGSDHASFLATLVEDKQTAVGSCHSCHNSFPSSTRTDIDRTNEILAFAPLTHVPWGLALRQPESEVFANTRVLSQRLAGLGLVILVVILGLVWVTTRNVIRPMQILNRACQQIAAGELTQRIPEMGVAETASLVYSFERMRHDLLNTREDMLAFQRNLEERVEERTAELTDTRDYLLKVNRDLTALNKTSATLVHNLDLKEALRSVLEQVLELFSGDVAGIFLLNERENALVLYEQIGLLSEDASAIKWIPLTVLFPAKHDSASLDSQQWNAAFSQALGRDLERPSILCIPLEEKGKFLGELFLAANLPNKFSSEDAKLMSSIGWQISMSIRNTRLYEAVQHKEQEKAEMLHQVIVAQEEERKRIARELHDDTSQGLATLILGLDTLNAALSVDPGEAAALQETNKTIARQMLEDIRRITTDLRPSLLDDLGLVPAIAWYGEKRLNPLGIALHLHGQDLEINRLPPDLEILFFRITQEAITNVIRHAHASDVEVRLSHQNQCVVVEVSDNGIGFDVQAIQSIDAQGKGLGLRGMRERANLMGGDLSIESLPGMGTTIWVSVPLQKGESTHVKDTSFAHG